MDLAAKIVRLREAKGWTSSRLARESGVSRSYLYQLEKGGKAEPSLSVLGRLAQALGVSLAEFGEHEPLVREDDMPRGLEDFFRRRARELGVTKSDLEVLRHTHFRGVQPQDAESWELLFLFLKKWSQ